MFAAFTVGAVVGAAMGAGSVLWATLAENSGVNNGALRFNATASHTKVGLRVGGFSNVARPARSNVGLAVDAVSERSFSGTKGICHGRN